MKTLLYCTIMLFLVSTGCSTMNMKLPKVSNGKIERINIQSKFVAQRFIDVWLPDGYSSSEKYSVLYFHDGQMLFDSTITWNKQDWMVDEVLTKLAQNPSIKKSIVVGIWNNKEYRSAEYFPENILEMLPADVKEEIIETRLVGKPLANNYLKFIVKELKPYIDSVYSTNKNPENTYLVGSSMGGLISLYGLCEYPNVFGGAGCLSTHLPITGIDKKTASLNNPAPKAFRTYIAKSLPSLSQNKNIYFDYGNKTLDSMYEPYQHAIDSIMVNKGYTEKNWMTKFFDGDDHSEKSWSKRLHIPLEFLLKKD